MNTEAKEVEHEIVDNGTEPDADSSLIDRQIATAKRYPRSIDQCKKEALTLATENTDVASSCFYSFPQGGTQVDGPSVRLAEIMVNCWGNMRSEKYVVDVLDDKVIGGGMCADLQKNTAMKCQTERSILNKKGKRYPDHMIEKTANAASSIAFRNAVFSVIPQAYIEPVYQAAREASLGKGKTMEQKREECMNWFLSRDVSKDAVLDLRGAEGVQDLSEQDLIDLRGMANAIEDNQVTIDQVFGDADSSSRTDEINQYIKNGSNGQAKTSDSDDEDQEDTEENEQPEDPDEEPEGDSSEPDEKDPEKKITPDEIGEFSDAFNADTLEEACRQRDLKVSGTKFEKAERLLAAGVTIDDIEEKSEDDQENDESETTESVEPEEDSSSDESESSESESSSSEPGGVDMFEIMERTRPLLNDIDGARFAQVKATIDEHGQAESVVSDLETYLEACQNAPEEYGVSDDGVIQFR